jgi:hypothetical protein
MLKIAGTASITVQAGRSVYIACFRPRFAAGGRGRH